MIRRPLPPLMALPMCALGRCGITADSLILDDWRRVRLAPIAPVARPRTTPNGDAASHAAA